MHLIKDEAEPTAVELLVMLLCELQEDCIPHADPERGGGRARRWNETLATVMAAIDGRVAYALRRASRGAP